MERRRTRLESVIGGRELGHGFGAVRMRRATKAIGFVAGWLGLGWSALATAAAPVPPATRAVADHVLAATVGITSSTADGASFTGTGSVITPSGHILTSTSVVPADAAVSNTVAPVSSVAVSVLPD